MHRGPRSPHPDLRGPFVHLLMRPGHFIFTLCMLVHDAELRLCIAHYLLSFRTRAIRSRVCKSRRVDTGEKGGRIERKRERRFFQYTSADTNTIVGKIITVFTGERIHCRASEPASRHGDSSQGRSVPRFEYLEEYFQTKQPNA